MMEKNRNQTEIDVVARLIRQAGRRENPSADEYEYVLAAASAALDKKIRQRRGRFAVWSVAATVVLSILAGLIAINFAGPETQPVAELDRVIGPVDVAFPGALTWQPLIENSAVLGADTRIRTGPGSRLGVLMNNGVSLRLAEATEVRFATSGRVELIKGKIYADAGVGSGEPRRIVVETGDDTTWDVGTQFEVSYREDQYRLRVREGEAYLSQPSRELRSVAGEQLTIDALQNVQRSRIARNDYAWQWTETVAPDPVIDARPVSDLLEWVSRQVGRKIEYIDPAFKLKAKTTMLYGNVHFLEPLAALETMLATTHFTYTLTENGIILVDFE